MIFVESNAKAADVPDSDNRFVLVILFHLLKKLATFAVFGFKHDYPFALPNPSYVQRTLDSLLEVPSYLEHY